MGGGGGAGIGGQQAHGAWYFSGFLGRLAFYYLGKLLKI